MTALWMLLAAVAGVVAGWAIRGALATGLAPRDEERERALREALGRVHGFLEARVKEPLERGTGGDAATLMQAARHALGAIEDLEFFLREPLTTAEVTDLGERATQVAREFAADWDVQVRVETPGTPVEAHVHPAAFMDALYLLLHNAGTFGGGRPIDLGVARDGGRARVEIRDRGPGFTDEALARAHELFFSTAPSGLGLGIPFARRVVEGFGGEIQLRNLTAGGAAVTVWLPGT